MKIKKNPARNFIGPGLLTLCLVYTTSAFAMDDKMMGTMPDPTKTDSMQQDPNDTSDSTAGNHNHKKMISEHNKMINNHKMMMKKDARAQMEKKKKMHTKDPADTSPTPDNNMPPGGMGDM